jgi:hypothetical protein
MDFERQANPATMPLDQEDMKGFDVDGSIPTKYRGSAGKNWTLPCSQCIYTDVRSRPARHGHAREEASSEGMRV